MRREALQIVSTDGHTDGQTDRQNPILIGSFASQFKLPKNE